MSILPWGWGVRKIEKEFEASTYMVRKVKELVKAKGILSTPNPKSGMMLKDDTVKLVCSRCMSGKKDFASVKEQMAQPSDTQRLGNRNYNQHTQERSKK
jgi:hypothetical protein